MLLLSVSPSLAVALMLVSVLLVTFHLEYYLHLNIIMSLIHYVIVICINYILIIIIFN